MSTERLIPPDPERCQTEWTGGSFMTFGPRPMVRCSERPTWIATQKAEPRGSMSLCDEHKKVLQAKRRGVATFQTIAEWKKARRRRTIALGRAALAREDRRPVK